MVVENAMSRAGSLRLHELISAVARVQAFEQVRVLDFQRFDRAESQPGLGCIFARQEWLVVGGRAGGLCDEVYTVAPVILGLNRHLLEVAGLKLRAAGVLVEILIAQRGGSAIK